MSFDRWLWQQKIDKLKTLITIDKLKTLLLQETRLNPENGGDAFFAKSGNPRTFKFRCRKCGEIVHMAKECRDKHKDGIAGDDALYIFTVYSELRIVVNWWRLLN